MVFDYPYGSISGIELDPREMEQYSGIDDLTHLVGPLTENSIVKCLEARFHNQIYQVSKRYSEPCYNKTCFHS